MVAEWKIGYVNDLYNKLKEARVFAIANAMDIPSSALQKIRKNLKEKGIFIKVVRKNLLIKALEKLAKENSIYKDIIDFLEKQKRITATLLIPKDSLNPFKLYKLIEENKTYRAARPGEEAPSDIIIPAGPTPFTPGPILSTLKKFGLKTKVEGGKIVITEDKIVAKKGEKITQELAELLNKFGIEPIEVKLRILLAYHNGLLYYEDILSIPPEKYIEDLKRLFRKAIALSVEIGIPTKYSAKILFRKAYENVIKLSLKTGIPTKETIRLLLIKAINTVISLSQYLPKDIRPIKIEVKEATEEIKEEKPKEEEKKEESGLEGLSSLFGF